ncbi:glycosyl hydrolase family 32 [candidate division KSB1 bacterium]|nr:glycosyl hydrolase family 32 [candidate division KSB1 bacterium]
MRRLTSTLVLVNFIFFLSCGALDRLTKKDKSTQGEVLYNGIILPGQWPPDYGPLDYGKYNRQPMPVPYLATPPAVIPIDVGRQLFVDDFLIEHTTLKRTFHRAELHRESPVLKPNKPWEMENRYEEAYGVGDSSTSAMVFSDGVWFDPQDQLFKMWYMCGYMCSTCIATSSDGIHWQKPSLDAGEAESNIVHNIPIKLRDSGTVWLDHEEKDADKRYKLFVVYGKGHDWASYIHASADGINWGEAIAQTEKLGDRSTIFYNPFRKKWIYSIRCCQRPTTAKERLRLYYEHRDPIAGAQLASKNAVFWLGADENDPQRPDLNRPCQLYNLDGVAYESLMLGLFTIWPGQPETRGKPNYIALGFSRDGFHWDRPDRRPFINVSEKFGDYNYTNVQSAGGCCLVVGDKLYFYFSARSGMQNNKFSGECTTGLAILRRDGFASMDAGDNGGTLTSRPLRFNGKYLFVNAEVQNGELHAELLEESGNVIEPFSRENCVAVRTNKTLQAVHWNGVNDFAALAGKTVRLRFHLRNGKLYSFWVSPDSSGASHGYIAAGGPGFTGSRDTVGVMEKEKEQF